MRLIEVVTPPESKSALERALRHHDILDHWSPSTPQDEDRRVTRLLVRPEHAQDILDSLQNHLADAEGFRIVVLTVEATLPKVPEPEEDESGEEAENKTRTTREELYESVSQGARLDLNFILLVCLSAIVATIGMIEDSAAVVIGAMVIAPLLGPNLALALGTALGDTGLMSRALRGMLVGLALSIAIGALIGLFAPVLNPGPELAARTEVRLDSVALALASGAAGVLSLTNGIASALVGVMVAVALLPPGVTLGLMLGSGRFQDALGAGLLLAVNIVCVNLSAKLVLLARGVRPRTWFEVRKARQSMIVYIAIWVVSLVILTAAILYRR